MPQDSRRPSLADGASRHRPHAHRGPPAPGDLPGDRGRLAPKDATPNLANPRPDVM